MNRKFILKGVVLPFAAALAAGIIFLLIFSQNAARLFPVQSGATLAYYDTAAQTESVVPVSEATPNAAVGTVTSDAELPLLYEADASNLLRAASLLKNSAAPGQTGCLYMEISAAQVAKISTDEPLTLQTADGEFTYRYTGEQLMPSKAAVLALSPDEPQSLIVLYRVTRGIGLTTDYYALTFKGVD